jgi:hypothetical protein
MSRSAAHSSPAVITMISANAASEWIRIAWGSVFDPPIIPENPVWGLPPMEPSMMTLSGQGWARSASVPATTNSAPNAKAGR